LACQNGGNPTPSSIAKLGGNTGPQGPGDGGGGNICNGRMIESYRVDIATLPEFSEFVQPILDKVTQKKDGKPVSSPFVLTPQSKNWFLIDCALNQVPKEVNGLYFETDQVAVHRTSEIFIDTSIFKTMAKEEKAKLLLHEMIMSYYLMKFLPLSQICKTTNTCSGTYDNVDTWKMFAPKTYRPLNEEDHQKIRAVTAWVWENRATLTPEEFYKVLRNKDFDSRFDYSLGTDNKDVEVDPASIVRMFKRYQWAKSFPKFCGFDETTSISTSLCETNVIAQIQMIELGGKPVKAIVLSVKIVREKDKKTFEQTLVVPLTQETLHLYQARFGQVVNAALFGAFSNWPGLSGPKKEGDRSYMTLFFLDLRDVKNPELFQIMNAGYVWYAFEDVFVTKEGVKYKETYGYRALAKDDSEMIFTESTLPFLMPFQATARDFISSEIVPN
jgi:hypothetical protein